MSPPWSKSKIEQGGHYRRNEGILWQINDVFVTGAAWGPDENKETTAKVVYRSDTKGGLDAKRISG
jgi:hypothetical protein